MREFLIDIHKKYIQGTSKKAIVVNKKILLCNLTNAVRQGGNFSCQAVYINTKALKHIYDQKPAEMYDFLISNLHKIVKYPDHIYKNKSAKRGNICLVKILSNEKYFCSIEDNNGELNIATAFRTEESYLRNFELLWSWRDDAPSS